MHWPTQLTYASGASLRGPRACPRGGGSGDGDMSALWDGTTPPTQATRCPLPACRFCRAATLASDDASPPHCGCSFVAEVPVQTQMWSVTTVVSCRT